MTLTDLFEKHKFVRRTVLAACILWVSATVGMGLYIMLTRPLTGPDTAFLTAVVGLMNVPILYYFHTREAGK